MANTNILINQGTSTPMAVNAVGTVNYPVFKMDIGADGVSAPFTGITTGGTLNAGTVRDDGRPARNILSFGTTIAFSGSAFATLVGSAAIGVGTSLWVNDVSIINNGGTQKAAVVFGSAINGSAILAKGQFGPQGGIQKSFPKAVNAGMTNTDLNAWAEGAGTIDFVVSYFISA